MAGRILIVDDEPALRRSILRLLKPFGYQIFQAGNGIEALTLLAGIQPDLIILDTLMPEMDGLRTCAQIRKSEPWSGPYIIFLSGSGQLEDQVAGLLAGADVYLTKPFDSEQLVFEVKKGLATLAHENLLNSGSSASHFHPRSFQRRYHQEVSRALQDGSELMILILQIEGFEQLVSSKGSKAAEQVQKAAEGVIKKALLHTDLGSRFAPGEFMLMMPGATASGVMGFAEEIRVQAAHSAPVENPIKFNHALFTGRHEGKHPFEWVLRTVDLAEQRS